MAAELSGSRQNPVFDRRILDQLACPVCFESLRPAENAVVCAGCGRAYPVIDGIPVLIAERAVESVQSLLD
jgi:uncharacterized protein YbaR (Trm112 family)